MESSLFARYFLFCVFVINSSFVFPWSDMGHRYTGIIAYNNLNSEVRGVILNTLKKHPDYHEHFLSEMPEEVKQGDDEIKSKWLFSQMACWPDVIKRRELNYENQYRRWHYINFPVYLTDIDKRFYKNNVPVNLKTSIQDSVQANEDWNIAQAYAYNKRILVEGTDAEKAVALCWIFHLVGDIHQPLHSTALFNERRFPRGDFGGNAINVKGVGTLHVAWDRATYNKGNKNWNFIDLVRFCDTASVLEGVSSLTKTDTSFSKWLDESLTLAKDVGYPQELLESVRKSNIEEYGFGNPLTLKLDKKFTRKWKKRIVKMAYERIGLAGRRIGMIAQTLLN